MAETVRGYHDKHARAIHMHKERALPDSVVSLYREAAAPLDPFSRPHLGCDVLYSFPRAVVELERISAELDAEFARDYKKKYVRGPCGFSGPRDDGRIFVWQVGLISR